MVAWRDGPESEATAEPVRRAPVAPPLGCLIVEDDPTRATLWTMALIEAGHSACAVPGIEAALDVLRSRPVDLVLVNLELATGGAEALADVSHRLQPEARVVLLANAGPGAEGPLLALAPNIVAILVKPIGALELTRRVGKLAARAH